MKTTKALLIEQLEWTIERIKEDDSFAGSISFEVDEVIRKEDKVDFIFEVGMCVKFGNREHGQGFSRVIMHSAEEE